MNPTVVFPKPVMSATFTELVIVQSLALYKTSSEATRINALPSGPHSSNKVGSPLFLLIPFEEATIKNVSYNVTVIDLCKGKFATITQKCNLLLFRKHQKTKEKLLKTMFD
jgi:hypothetical protein